MAILIAIKNIENDILRRYFVSETQAQKFATSAIVSYLFSKYFASFKELCSNFNSSVSVSLNVLIRAVKHVQVYDYDV